jgi:hypothetical protein
VPCWFFPLPVFLVVWLFDIRHPFGDIMCGLIPLYMTLPIWGAFLGAIVGTWIGRGRQDQGDE